MTVRSVGVWTLRIVNPDSGLPAPGVPVTLLDMRGETVGHWVSDAEGLVEIPRSESERVRLRVGLWSEEPFEVLPGELRRGVVELPAPKVPLPVPRPELVSTRPKEGGDDQILPPQVLLYHRLGVLGAQPPVTIQEEEDTPGGLPGPDPVSTLGIPPVDFFSVAVNYPAPVRYGVLVELEQHWHPLGYALGDLLYSVPLAPGDQARVAILDGRERHRLADAALPEEAVPRERPLYEVARHLAARSLVDALDTDDGFIPLEPFTIVPDSGGPSRLADVSAEAVRFLSDRSARVTSFLRNRRAFGVLEVRDEGRTTAPVRVVRNTDPERIITYEYFETLQRYRVVTRLRRVRPAILLPFRMPNLATMAVVRQYGYVLRRALLDRTLGADLDRLLGLDDEAGERANAPAPITQLRIVAHVSAGDHALDLWQASCYLHIDGVRHAIHFTPAEAPPGGVTSAAIPRTTHWIGSVRPAELHTRTVRYPGQLVLENASLADLMFEAMHVEGRTEASWRRLHTFNDLVLPAESRMQLLGVGATGDVPGSEALQSRLLAHIAANLPYYSAAIIAGGDPALRYLALTKVRDADGRAIADIIENTVIGVTGNYVAFPLRGLHFAPPELHALFAVQRDRPPVMSEESTMMVPTPGVWLRTQVGTSTEGGVAPEQPRGGAGGAPGEVKPGWRASRGR